MIDIIPKQFYENWITFDESKSSEEQLYALCPFHQEDTPSFTVNTETGAWYCHACAEGGHYVEFVEKIYDVSRSVAADVINEYKKRGIWMFPSDKDIESNYQILKKRGSFQDELHSFGITDEIIDELKIGCRDLYIYFPIFSRTGKCINIRKYLLPSKRGPRDKKTVGLRYLNSPRFYPYKAFEEDKIYIVEGEKDMAVARSQGLNAVTSTGGSSFPRNELFLFKNKEVYIMTDSDDAGNRLAMHYYEGIVNYAQSVRRIDLPVKDFTDYWMQFKNIELEQFTKEMASRHNDDVAETITLAQSESVSSLNTWVRLDNMSIVGTDPKTFTIPKILCLKCGHRGGACSTPCPIGTSRDPELVPVDPRQMVMFVDSSDNVQDNYLRKTFGCREIIAEPEEYTNVQKILFQETASFVEGLEDTSFEHRYGLYCYEDARLMPTAKYDLEACRVTDPRTQQNFFVIRKAVTSAATLQGMALSDSTINYFQSLCNMTEDKNSLEEFMNIHYDMWKPMLGIEGRPDLFLLILLTYMSVTEINWKAGKIKGWLDSMVIGDTRTGKSQMAQRFVKQLKMGSYINGENSRRTGVIGGVQRFGDSWVITWGAIPLNDKGLLIIDEASGLTIDDIKELSATRSSGAVSINKIAKGEARARTRLLWLSNPRSGRNLDEFYWKGFGAFQEYIPVAEDQARFDLVLSAAREDVDVSKLLDNENSAGSTMMPNIDKYRELAAFAWAVEADSIKMTNEVIQQIKQEAIQLEKDYGGGPLIVGVAVHEKILRISAALAILCGSIKNEPRTVHVQAPHVRWAVQFLRSCLEKDTFDYSSYIREARKSTKEKEKNVTFIRAQVAIHDALPALLSSNQFRGVQVKEILGVSQDESSKLLSELLKRGLLKITASGAYAPNKMLIDIVKQIGGGF